MNAHSQVRHDANAHAGLHGLLLRGGALAVGDKLQPHVEAGQLFLLLHRHGNVVLISGVTLNLSVGAPAREGH